MLASNRQPPVRGMLACSDKLLLFPSRVLTRSGSADPELTVSACVCFRKKTGARHSDKKPQYMRLNENYKPVLFSGLFYLPLLNHRLSGLP